MHNNSIPSLLGSVASEWSFEIPLFCFDFPTSRPCQAGGHSGFKWRNSRKCYSYLLLVRDLATELDMYSKFLKINLVVVVRHRASGRFRGLTQPFPPILRGKRYVLTRVKGNEISMRRVMASIDLFFHAFA